MKDCERAEASERDAAAKRLYSDFAATVRTQKLKADTPVHGERVAKYKRLMGVALKDR